MTSLIKPDSGTIKICGFNVVKEPHKVHEIISLTGQYAAVDESLTGLENLIIIGKLNHLPNPKKRALELLEYFHLADASSRFVSTYSGGMRRKLDIAMSLVNHPSVIFLDEPTTGLDPQSRHSMWNIIRDLKDKGITIFLTTQYLEEAEQLADKIAILDKGSIIVEGTLSELKTLLPQGIIEFTFSNKQDIKKAKSFLDGYKIIEDSVKYTLTIFTDGSINTLTKILQIFASQAIIIQEFERKIPSLEDVFLTLIKEKEKF